MVIDQAAPAAARAIAHAEAWSNHDWDTARAGLASDVHVTAMSTQPSMPATDTTGADEYMEGLIRFASSIEPGSARIIASIGDAETSLILLTVKGVFGPGGPKTLAGSRLAAWDENQKLKDERVVFFVLPE
jgi:SnoaL-like domain